MARFDCPACGQPLDEMDSDIVQETGDGLYVAQVILACCDCPGEPLEEEEEDVCEECLSFSYMCQCCDICNRNFDDCECQRCPKCEEKTAYCGCGYC